MSDRRTDLPCMCGSGKTYETCCMEENAERKRRVEEANEITVDVVVRAHEPRFADEMSAAKKKFPGGGGNIGEIENHLFLEWLIHDHVLENHKKTMLEMYADDESRTQREKEVTCSLAGAHLGIYKVTGIRRGLGITMRDMFDNSERFVYDKAISMAIKARPTIMTRLHELDGMTIMCGLSHTLLGDEQAETLKKFIQDKSKRTGCADLEECLQKNAHTIMMFAHELSERGDSADDEESGTVTTVLYQLNSGSEDVVRMLRDANGFVYGGIFQGTHGFTVVDDMPAGVADQDFFTVVDNGPASMSEPDNAGLPPKAYRAIGIAAVKDDEITLICKSDSMTERARARLESILGDYITFVTLSHHHDDIPTIN